MRTLLAFMASLCGLLLATPIMLLSLPFWVVAWLTRVWCPVFERRSASWEQVVEFNPTVGWKPKANLDVFCDCGYCVYHVITDAQGYRSQVSFAESDVVVFGDSFAFGQGVDDEKTFFSGQYSSLRIKTIASPGYSMVHGLILMRQLQSLLQGKLVVWFVYYGNDLHDNLQPNLNDYRAPFVRQVDGTGSWEIVTRHLSPAKWPFNYEESLQRREKEKWIGTFGTNGLSERIYAACEFLIREARDVCHQAGGRLVVLAVPMTAQLSRRAWKRDILRLGIKESESLNPLLPDQRLQEICSKFRVPFVAGKEYLTVHDLLWFDGHWNEKGHRRIEALLQSLYNEYAEAQRSIHDYGTGLPSSGVESR